MSRRVGEALATKPTIRANATNSGRCQDGGFWPSCTHPTKNAGSTGCGVSMAGMKNVEDIYALSPMQQGLLFHAQGTHGGADYLEQFHCQIHGPLEPELLQQAWQATLARHGILRSSFHWQGLENPVQVVRKQVPLPWEQLDWRGLREPEGHYQALLRSDRQRGLSLEQAPLMRLQLIQLADHWRLLWTFHHLLLDGWCSPLILQEVLEHYASLQQGRPAQLPHCRPYKDYILWLQQQNMQRAEDFWRGHLAAFDHSTPLPALVDESLPGAPGVVDIALSENTTNQLQQRIREARLTLASVLQGAWSLLLAHQSGESRVLFGATVAGRPATLPGVETMIGLFINTLPVPVEIPWETPLQDWLRQLRDQQAAREAYAYTPLSRIQGWSALPPGSSLFESIVVVENYPEGSGDDGPLEIREADLLERSHYPLSLVAAPGERLQLRLKHDGKRCRESSTRQLAAQLATLLEQFSENLAQPLGAYTLLDEATQQLIVREFNRSQVAHPQEPCLHQLFEAQVQRSPHRPALQMGEITLSYGELNTQANTLAQQLQRLGVAPETVVAVQLERAPQLVISLLAILKAGGAYCPLEPGIPLQRRDTLLTEAGCAYLLAPAATRQTLPPGVRGVEPDGTYPPAETNPHSPVQPQHLAYVLFTSGSTGRPKGVMVSHRAIVNHMYWSQSWYPLTPEDRVLQKTPYTFDASLCDLFTPLLHGALLVLARPGAHQDSPYLVEQVREHSISVLQLVPSLLRLLLATPGIEHCQSLRMLFCGGEALEPALVERCLNTLAVALHNVYGPTEATIHAAGWSAFPGCQRVPIGKPIDNCRLYVLDRHLEPLPVGAPGELFIAGINLARGYVGRPGLTAAAFLPDPFSPVPGERMYRSGDRCRWLADGTLEYLGRMDRQLKFRGQRLEPGEIEGLLGGHPSVAEAAVGLQLDPATGRDLLVAHVSGRGAQPPDSATLAEYLRQRLPATLLPNRWVMLATLPHLPSGKLDRAALAAAQGDNAPQSRPTQATPPRDEREQTLASIWCQVLKLPQVGIEDNFFELGGDSILSLQVASKARQAGLAVNPGMLFEHPSIARLAQAVGESQTTPAQQAPLVGEVPLLPLQVEFFNANPINPHWYNQSLWLRTPASLTVAALELALGTLLHHHDGLRARFQQHDGGWQARIAPPGEVPALEVHEGADTTARLAIAEALQQGLDIQRGPLLRAAYCPQPGEPGWLLLVIHHLAVDGVSWRILLEDLESLLQGQPLPPRSHSLRDWATTLATPERFATEQAFWAAQQAPVLELGPAGSVAQQRVVERSLDGDTTRVLLETLPAQGQCRVEEVLLAALAASLCAWCGVDSLGISLEGHGRGPLAGLDVSRTVGWFTCRYPLRLQQPKDSTPLAWLQMARERLRQVPNGGLGAGVLAKASDTVTTPTVSFNYLGRLDSPGEAGMLSISEADNGAEQAPENPRRYPLGVDALVLGGKLRISLSFNGSEHSQEAMETLADGLLQQLQQQLQQLLQVTGSYPLAGLPTARCQQLTQQIPDLEDLYPLSPLQQGLLSHSLQDPSGGAYVEQLVVEFAPRLDIAALRRAWEWLLARHTTLRMGCLWQDLPRGLAAIRRKVALPWQQQHWPANQQQHLADYLQQDRRRGFAMDRAPLMRLLLAQHPQGWTLVWSHHHLLLDGWCMPQLLEELDLAYRQFRDHASPPTLPPPPAYRDYIAWLEAQPLEAAADFWRSELAGFAELTPLPLSPAGEVASDVRILDCPLSGEHHHRLEPFCRQYGLTLATLLQGLWGLLLGQLAGRREVVFGLTVSGRPTELPGVEGMLGPFINTLPVRLRAEQRPLLNWLQQIQTRHGQRMAWQHTPLSRIQGWSDIPPQQPLFEALLVVENLPGVGEDSAALPLLGGELIERSHFPLTLVAVPEDSGLLLRLKLDVARLTVDPEQLAAQLLHLLGEMLDAPQRPVTSLGCLPPAQYERLIQQWNYTRQHHDPDALLNRCLAQQAQQSPTAPALRWWDGELSYQQLERCANHLAWRLRELGIGPERRVGIHLPRSPELVIALLATLKAGGAYLPLEPELPAQRLATLAHQAGVQVVLSRAGQPSPFTPETPLLPLDTSILQASAEAPPEHALQADNLAYVLYTSGSTGAPKAVMVSHRAICNHMAWTQRVYPLYPTDRVLQRTPLSFDASLCDLFTPLLHGATLVLAEPGGHRDAAYLLRTLSQEAISVLQLTPSLLRELLLQLGDQPPPASLRLVFCGGEALPLSLAQNFKHRFPQAELHNVYGPAEATIHTSGWTVPAEPRQIRIGTPIDNVRVHLLDGLGRPVPPGAVGEICIGGTALARGYLQQPGLTAERFVPDPLGLEPGARLYRSGDLGRYDAHGQLEFLGRRDGQIKRAGARIEPAEIESTLMAHPGVLDAAVVLAGEPQQLLAHLVLQQPPPTDHSLREYLLARLPSFMLPTGFVPQSQIPRLSSGKLDRQAIQRLPVISTGSPTRQPQTPQETLLLEGWRQVLGAELSIDDDFFARGGDSFRAVQLSGWLAERGLELSTGLLYRYPTVRSLAPVLDNTGSPRLVHPLNQQPGAPLLICLPPLLGHGIIFQGLAASLESVQVLGVDFPEGTTPLEHCWQQLGSYLDGRPCWLLGYSAGGTSALALAQRLEACHYPLKGLILLDAWLWPEGLQVDTEAQEQMMERAFALLNSATGSLPGEARLRQRMAAYLDYLAQPPMAKSLSSPISLIQAERDLQTQQIMQTRWAKLGSLHTVVGSGGHYQMLQPGEHLLANSAAIKTLLSTS